MTTSIAEVGGTTSELEQKHERVRSILDDSGSDGVWLTSASALSWFLDGARVHTSLLGAPVAAVLVRRDEVRVRVFANEAERLLSEELPRGLTVEEVPWHGALVDADARGDVHLEDALAAPLRAARAVLLPAERARFARLGHDAARALTTAMQGSRPDETERQLAARVAASVTSIGADPAVVMVAGASRLGFRHPLPTDAPLGRRAMVVVCARRHGLIANLTRWVRFGSAAPEEARRTAALLRVESAFFGATRPGSRLGDVLSAGAAAYAAHGFEADEWTRHHQGGAAGYAGRDPRASPGATDVVHDGQAFAWNPTAPGVKVEDTVVVDGGRVEVLTRDDDWPTVVVDGVARPEELEL